MTDLKRIALTDRAVLRVSGPEARGFLQGIVTNNVERVDPTRAIYSALLTPQGKFLFDFIMADDGTGGLLIDTAHNRAAELSKRLGFYKLRARAEITDVSDDVVVTALIGDGASEAVKLHSRIGNAWRNDAVVYMVDPRLATLGVRCLHPADTQPLADHVEGTLDDYHTHRMALAVPEAGADVLVDKSFILESNFEELNAVDFEKGCYVGQELTARTKYRGTVRRRLFAVKADDDLPDAGTPITVGTAEIGELRSAINGRGIALIRTDRLEEVGGDAAEVMAGDVRVTPVKPDWVSF
ncbi:MAG: folate-binding protein YgfZ [Rhodospirillales bacterium]|nr:folate-binding protein YgfZ [Rhodospirillales bacterium]